jgi:hypothetical protein
VWVSYCVVVLLLTGGVVDVLLMSTDVGWRVAECKTDLRSGKTYADVKNVTESLPKPRRCVDPHQYYFRSYGMNESRLDLFIREVCTSSYVHGLKVLYRNHYASN